MRSNGCDHDNRMLKIANTMLLQLSLSYITIVCYYIMADVCLPPPYVCSSYASIVWKQITEPSTDHKQWMLNDKLEMLVFSYS